MTLLQMVILYFAMLAVCFGIDIIWLGLMNSRFYKVKLAGLMSEKVNWLPGILFYALFVFGLIVLVVLPAVDTQSWVRALLWGGLFGMVAYSTYDLTNLTTIKNWPVIVTVVDIIWGTVFSATASVIGYFIANALT